MLSPIRSRHLPRPALRRAGAAVLAGLVVFVLAAEARAQAFRTPTDTLNVAGRSSVEEGYLGFFNLNRAILGPRAQGMAGAGLALTSGVESMALNPAAMLGTVQWEVASEFAFRSGGGNVARFPDRLDVGLGQPLEASGYRVSPQFTSGYVDLTLGVPLVLFGNRGALGISYRRMSPGFQGEETRFEVVGPITNNIPAITGVGDSPDGGHDAISLAVARNMGSMLDLGVALNIESGEISNANDVGASVFGQQVTGGGYRYSQDVSAMSLDLGAKARLGALQLGGSVFIGHNLDFEKGDSRYFPLPDVQDPNSPVFMINTTLTDHTLSIPTSIGLGGAYDVNDRLTVAADYWIRPWSDIEITRQSIDPTVFFTNPADSSTFGFVLTNGTGDETFSAGYGDANSFRVGAEYILTQTDRVTVPVRVGFRSETLALTNVAIPEEYTNYVGLLLEFWRASEKGLGRDPARGDELEAQLENVLEFNRLAFTGTPVDATTISFGFGVTIDNFTIEAAAERTSYDIDRFFFQPFDPLFNPLADFTKESRNITNLSLATRMRF